jgi:hypothetical protein
MGRRSRKRTAPPAELRRDPAPERRPPPPSVSRRARLEDAPKPPWHPFPLVELAILAGMVLVVLGVLDVADRRGVLLGCGFALITVAGLELSVREHFAGYRSHSTLLAATCAILAALPFYFWTAVPQEAVLVVGLAAFAAAFLALRGAFRRRTGGVAFRA